MSVNKCILVGRIGKNPEIRTTQQGKKIATFSLATSNKWRDKNTGEVKEQTEWHKIVVFNEGLASVVENYLKKGSKVYVEGELRTRKWTDKQGKDNYTTEIVLQGFNSTLVMLDTKNNSPEKPTSHNSYNKKQASQDVQAPHLYDDEMPF